MREVTELLTSLDEFIRSSTPVAAELGPFLSSQGQRQPGFPAPNVIDEVSFAALQLPIRLYGA